jgi:hypothetical protein
LNELDVADQDFAFGVSFQGNDHVFAFGCGVNLFGIELSQGVTAWYEVLPNQALLLIFKIHSY